MDEEPEEVRNAWEELMMIQREQQRYTDIRMDQQHDLNKLRKEQKKLEDVSIMFSYNDHCGPSVVSID